MPAKNIKIAVLLIAGVAVIVAALFLIPPGAGTGDFRPYWSSTYLFRTGQDFSSLSSIDAAERALTAWDGSYTMMAWFAPTGNLVLLPYTLIPFSKAANLWLITNIAFLFFSARLFWRKAPQKLWPPLVLVFGYSMTLVSLNSGQINFLEILGLALFLYFQESGKEVASGASLVLTTIKPHLVILTLPLLILDLGRRRKWRALAGFAGTLIACGAFLLVLNPAWPLRFWQLVSSGLDTIRQTPDISGLLVLAGETSLGKWVWPLALLGCVALWFVFGKKWNQRTMIDLSIIAGLMVAPVGWSYDQVILLIPLLHILEWMVEGALGKVQSAWIAAVLILANLVSILERLWAPSEVYFFWIPLFVAVVYAFALQARRLPANAEEELIPAA